MIIWFLMGCSSHSMDINIITDKYIKEGINVIVYPTGTITTPKQLYVLVINETDICYVSNYIYNRYNVGDIITDNLLK